jgi:phosphoribosylglycinamide formyltransferase-1
VAHLRLGFLASHNGSSMRAIVAAARAGTLDATPCVVISNNAEAPALAFAREQGIPACHLSRSRLGEAANIDSAIADALAAHRVELVICSGYMRKLGPATLGRHRGRIINIHPGLLPQFGGQGMYGDRVHMAVIAAGATVSGATIHLVDEEYDHGLTLARREVPVLPGDTTDSLAGRVRAIEPPFFVETLQRIAAGTLALPPGEARL